MTSPELPETPGSGGADDTPAAIRKRILFISLVLGLMTGVTVYLGVKAVQTAQPALIAVVLPMFLVAIPMVRTLRQLRAKGRAPGKG